MEAFAGAPFSKACFCLRGVCFAAGGLQPVLPSHVTHLSDEGEHGLKKTKECGRNLHHAIYYSFHFLCLFVFILAKGEEL